MHWEKWEGAISVRLSSGKSHDLMCMVRYGAVIGYTIPITWYAD